MITYRKLVRDRIPTIIRESGKSCTVETLTEERYAEEIRRKLHEELNELERATTKEEAIEELADLAELLHAAAASLGTTYEEVERIRRQKAKQRGAFRDRQFLIDVSE